MYFENQLPAKIIPSKHVAYSEYYGQASSYVDKKGKSFYSYLVSHEGVVIPKHAYEVLCCEDFSWACGKNGNVPPNAIPGGITSCGETLYIGRAPHQGALIPGRIHPSHKNLYVCSDGKDIAIPGYEVLVDNQQLVLVCPRRSSKV